MTECDRRQHYLLNVGTKDKVVELVTFWFKCRLHTSKYSHDFCL